MAGDIIGIFSICSLPAWRWYALRIMPCCFLYPGSHGCFFFFLVAFEYEKAAVRRPLLDIHGRNLPGHSMSAAMFLILGTVTGSLDFDSFTHGLSAQKANICFILALIGFWDQSQASCHFTYGSRRRIPQRQAMYQRLCRES